MVKADSRRDYYGDLELKPSADVSEVKKQFKKLALKYHPDRNPGKEVEFNAKFQAIQSAHEVLTDPAQRAKYDADRIRAGGLHAYMPPPPTRKPNPPQRSPTAANFAGATRFTTNEFPPPPRRPPPSRTKTTFASSTPGGAESNWQYARTKPSHNGAKTSEEDAQEKVNMFKAWDQMRNSRARGPPGYVGRGEAPQQSPPKARTTWETAPDTPNTKSGRVPRRQGFAPSNSAGDESQARHTSAYHHANGERPGGFMPPPPGPPPKKADPLRAFKAQVGIDDSSERVSTPYATVGGERTYFSSAGLGRSASTRTSNQPEDGRSNLNIPSVHSRRNNSASPKMTSPRPERNRSYSSTSSEDSDIYNRSRQEPRSRGGKSTYPSWTSQRPASKSPFRGHGDDERSKSKRPTFGSPFPTSHEEGINKNNSWAEDVRKQENDDSQRRSSSGYTEGFLKHRLNRSGQYSQPQSPRFRAEHTMNGDSPLHHQKHPPERPRSWHEKNHSSDSVRMTSGEPKVKPSIFTFPIDESTFKRGPPLKSQSTENIDINFSPSDKEVRFTGNQDYFPTRPNDGTVKSSYNSPIDTAQKPHAGASSNIHANLPYIPPPPNSYPPDPNKLSPEDWSKHFRPATWVHPSPPHSPIRTGIGSTKRPKPTRKTSRATKRPAIPRPATAVDDADDELLSNETFASAKSTVSSTSSNAMDIDPALGGVPAVEPEQKDSLDLGDLKNVAPLASSNGGLQDLNDLSSTLPFESRASNHNNPAVRIPPPLDLPKPPKAIPAPEAITQTTAERYVVQMDAYMNEWNAFNDRMLRHFDARQKEVLFLKPKWMSAVGDDEYNRYMRGAQDDVRVRIHWNVSWDKHIECMKDLGATRARMKGVIEA